MEALQLVQGILEEIAIPIDTSKKDQMMELIQASVGTKFMSRWGTMISELALQAARTVMIEQPNGKVEVDLKRYARVERSPAASSMSAKCCRASCSTKT
jgi:T-complex protein 1 subunit gamma